MTNSILIGKAIRSILGGQLSTKVFPLVADNGTNFPFICYTRESITEDTPTKDGSIGDIVIVRVDVVADTYNESITIANSVRHILEKPLHITEGLKIEEMFLSGIDESWDSDTYIQRMRFTCYVTDITQNI